MREYAQIDRQSGAVLRTRTMPELHRDGGGRIVWLPLVREPQPPFDPTGQRLEQVVSVATDVVTYGWVISDLPLSPLADVAAAKRAQVEAERDRRRHPGTVETGLGWPVDLRDERDEANIGGKALRAATIKMAGTAETIDFMGADDEIHTLTPDEMIAVGRVCDDLITSVYGASWVIKAAIDAAVDADDRAALDVVNPLDPDNWP